MKPNWLIIILIVIIVGITVGTIVFVNISSDKEYNATLPSNAVQFSMPNMPYKFEYTNDYTVDSSGLTVYSFYTENINGHYKYIKQTSHSTEYTLYK